MKTIDGVFKIHRARSGLFSDYEAGEVAYIGNSVDDNGLVGFVSPIAGDKIFEKRAIVVSAFCEATVQAPPFIACGRAGNGLVVLEPRVAMKAGQLAYYAAYINAGIRWRFNWYRQVTADRLKRIQLPTFGIDEGKYPVKEFLPDRQVHPRGRWRWKSQLFSLESLFKLVPGDYHSLNALPKGTVPVVSCGSEDNGVAGYFGVQEHLHSDRLTIALNGSPMATKYHPYSFAAKDDVAVCVPLRDMKKTTLLFVQAMLERERWRYSYYRKCYLNKLGRFAVSLPARDGKLDEDVMETVIASVPYWGFLDKWSPGKSGIRG